ncbi:ABC transporter ATP-binding protein [uncultured Streptococcus sp.]|mgnify:CR=1 FL=1|uniref:ABC transporter ATP-binding protein n=1 Tax=uncultured Streptococcus sp. TaxID=83427 RepID=UPI00258FB1AA|nr:ABC transporter ATP-binding protein [uncultured Streptococcus sp.]
MTSIISVKNLRKTYQHKTVVDNISFDVEEGSLFSFLGPNGAGKSTTINIICTVLNATSGEVIIDGQNVKKHSKDIRKKIGVVYQQNVLDNLLTVSENLRFRASLFGILGKEFEDRLEAVAKELDFQNYLNQPFHTLSGGQKRRVEIARAIFHEPKILLLDEPTTGLDSESRKTVWEIIGKLKKTFGMTIFLTTHYLEEARNSDLITVINKGKIVAAGSAISLQKKYSCDRLLLYPYKEAMNHLIANVKNISLPYTIFDDRLVIENPSVNNVLEILKYDSLIDSFEFFKGNLDDAFINILKQTEDSVL